MSSVRRRFGLALLFLCFLCLVASAEAKTIVVAADGSGDFKTVQQAVDRVLENNTQRVVIRIKPGVYREQVRVSSGKRFLTFRGDDPRSTILSFRISAQAAGNTRLAFSTFIGADEFLAENITFENSFGTGSQAVALFVDADRAEFRNCRFLGWQDTLFINGARHVFRNWPYARVVFLECWLGSHIKPEGWDNWRDPAREKTASFAEYKSTGRGANPRARVALSRQLISAEAVAFSRERFFSSPVHALTGAASQSVGTIAWADAQKKPDEWFATVEALRIADNLLLYQRHSGGWPKNIDMAKPLGDSQRAAVLRDKRKNDSTIDNSSTFTQLSFLARVFMAQRQERHRESFLKGLDYLLKAQYPNGGWPQFYPDLSGYYKHITFNDGAMIGVMKLLRDVAQAKPAYAFVDEARRARAAHAVEKGIECILKTQVVVNGRRTVWCAQHDEVTLAPAPARKYEVVSLSGGESVDVVRFLMSIKNPSAEVIEAIEAAVAWFEQVQLKDAKGAATWARFYEIGTNRPIFVGRDGVIKYNIAEIEEERRNGYAWYVDDAARLLSREYPAWHKQTTR
jgi:PelA/Pel-15E family pectate lyase